MKRIELLRALEAASNAFHAELHKRGLEVSYSLNDTHTGTIYKRNAHPTDCQPLGEITIKWKLNKNAIDMQKEEV